MSRFSTFVTTAVTALVVAAFAPSAARAESGIFQCAPNVPGSVVLTCVPASQGVAPAPEAVATGQLPGERTLDGRTHNWLAPTGELLAAGDAEVKLHGFIYADAAIGVSDNLEISFAAPLIPVFGKVGARVALTPRTSALKLVVGVGAYLPLFEGADVALLQVTGTAAYQTPRLNLHATISLLEPTGGDGDETLGVLNVGGTFKLGRKVALMVELVQIGFGEAGGPSEFLNMSMIGLKFMGASVDTDLGLLIPHLDLAQDSCDGCDDDDGELGALPMISMTYKY